MLVVLCDVCVELSVLLIEVYIFNVYVCEEFCCYFYFSFIVIGVIVGFGIQGYLLVLWYLVEYVGM